MFSRPMKVECNQSMILNEGGESSEGRRRSSMSSISRSRSSSINSSSSDMIITSKGQKKRHSHYDRITMVTRVAFRNSTSMAKYRYHCHFSETRMLPLVYRYADWVDYRNKRGHDRIPIDSNNVFCTCISGCGRYLFCGLFDGRMLCFDLSSNNYTDKSSHSYHHHYRSKQSYYKLIQEWSAHTHVIYSLCFHSRQGFIASGGKDNTVRVWDGWKASYSNSTSSTHASSKGNGGLLMYELSGHTGSVKSVKFIEKDSSDTSSNSSRGSSGTTHTCSGDNNDCLISSSNDRSIRVWLYKREMCLRRLTGHTDKISTLEYCRSSDQIVSGSWDRSVRLWKSKQATSLPRLKSSQIISMLLSQVLSMMNDMDDFTSMVSDSIHQVSLNSDQSLLSVCFEQGILVYQWPLVLVLDDDHAYGMSGGSGTSRGRSHSADDDAAASAVGGGGEYSESSSDTLLLLEKGESNIVWMKRDFCRCAAFHSTRPSLLALGGINGSVHLYDVRLNKHVLCYPGHSDWIRDIKFTPDGSKMISVSGHRQIHISDISSLIYDMK